MENSTNSMGNNSPDDAPQQDSPEESSWTMYFEEFFAHKNHNLHDESCPLSFGCDDASSVVSDAASSAAAKYAAKERFPISSRSRKTRLGFKKRNKSYSKGAFMVEDDLEDTASSPKLGNMKVDCRNQKQKGRCKEIFPQQGRGRRQGQKEGKRGERGLIDGRENEANKSSKQNKGFCLLPLSMAVKYLP